MQTTKLRTLILLSLSIAFSSLSKENPNPFSHYDNDYIQWRLFKLNYPSEPILRKSSFSPFTTFLISSPIITLDDRLNHVNNYKAKLAPRLLHFFTNKYKPAPYKAMNPFRIESKKLDQNLSPYHQKSLSIAFSLKGADKVEILDIIPSQREVIPWICTKESLIEVPACAETEYETHSAKVSIVVNIKIYPTTKGRYTFKLYVLTRVNDEMDMVVTIPGQLSVAEAGVFRFEAYESLLRVEREVESERFLWLKNRGNKPLTVNSVDSFGKGRLIGPDSIKPEDFENVSLTKDARRKLESLSAKQFWKIPGKEERPILKLGLGGDGKESRFGLEELDWVSLKNNVVRVVVDQQEYFLSLTTFFHKKMLFWDHDFINFGVLASKGLYLDATIYASNKANEPAVLKDVIVEWENKDFEVRVALTYSHELAFPYSDQRFKFMKLFIKYRGKDKMSILRGRVKAILSYADREYEEDLSFFSIYSYDSLLLKKEEHNYLISPEKLSFDVMLKHRMPSVIYINSLSLNDKDTRNKKKFSSDYDIVFHKKVPLKHGAFENLFTVVFKKPEREQTKYKEDFLLSLHTMGTVITKKVRFYYENLLCSILNDKKRMVTCNTFFILNFGYLRKGKKKLVEKWFIRNPLPITQTIKTLSTETLSNIFVYKLVITRYSKKKGRTVITKIDLSRDSKYELNIKLKKKQEIRLSLEIKMSPSVKSLDKHIQQETSLLFTTATGKKFNSQIQYGFLRGRVKLQQPIMKKTLIYPGTQTDFQINAFSSFVIPLQVRDMKRVSVDKHLEITTFSSKVDPGKTEGVFIFTFKPNNNPFKDGHTESQSRQSKDSVCLHDIDNHYNAGITWSKIRENNSLVVKAKYIIELNIGIELPLVIEITLVPPPFLDTPLFFGFNLLDGVSRHDLRIKNPFDKPMEFRLFLAPREFLDVDAIDREVISQIRRFEESELDNIICMSNSNMSAEEIRFLANNIYSDKLKFVKNPKTIPKQHGICFLMPNNQEEAEELYYRLTGYKNFYFKFDNFKNKEDFLKQKTVLISDIDDYTFFERKRNKQEEPIWKDIFRFYINNINKLYKKIKGKDEIKPIKNKREDSFKLEYVKNRKRFFENKELFIDKKYLNRTFTLPPKESMTLKNAIVINPQSRNRISSTNKQETIFLLKNNITHLHSAPIKYMTVVDKILAFSKRHKNPSTTMLWELKLIRFFTLDSIVDRHLQIRRPLIEEFNIINKGDSPIFIKGITLGDNITKEPCLKLLDFQPQLLEPVRGSIQNASPLKITFLFHICQRMHRNITVPIYLHSPEKSFKFDLTIFFANHIVKYVDGEWEREHVPLALAFFFCLHIVAWLAFLWNSCRKTRALVLHPKRRTAAFLSDERLREKIDRYKTEVRVKELENQPKVPPVQPKKNKRRKKQRSKSKVEKPKNGSRLIPDEICLDEFNYADNLYPNTYRRSQPNNSCISNETFEILFPKAEEDSVEKIEESRRDLFEDSQSVVGDDLHHRHGVIGEESFSRFDYSANETFNSRTANPRKKSEHTSTENFLTSLIIDQKLNNQSDDESWEEEEEMEEVGEVKTNRDGLDDIFGISLAPKVEDEDYEGILKRSNTEKNVGLITKREEEEKKKEKEKRKGKMSLLSKLRKKKLE